MVPEKDGFITQKILRNYKYKTTFTRCSISFNNITDNIFIPGRINSYLLRRIIDSSPWIYKKIIRLKQTSFVSPEGTKALVSKLMISILIFVEIVCNTLIFSV